MSIIWAGSAWARIVVTVHGAVIALAHSAWSVGHVASSPANWLAVLSVMITATALVFVIASIVARLHPPQKHPDDDDSDFRGGGGRRGPDAPNGPEGDPAWWPEFERQFAAYVARSKRARRSSTIL